MQQRKYGTVKNYDQGGFFRTNNASNSTHGGVLIYHVDENVRVPSDRNFDKPSHYRAGIKEAHGGLLHLEAHEDGFRRSVEPATIDHLAGTITIAMPAGTNLENLTPVIEFNGAALFPESGAANNFTNPVTYTVTSATGFKMSYVVTVTMDSLCYISAFSIPNSIGSAAINQLDKIIQLFVPSGTDLTDLAPEIEFRGASISPASGVSRDFTNPVIYTVTSANGNTITYVVMVRIVAQDGLDLSVLYHPASGENLTNSLGSYVYYGVYKDGENEKPRLWYVTGEENGALVLVQHDVYTNEARRFSPVSSSLTWRGSEIYSWLNNVGTIAYPFTDLFKDNELAAISRTEVNSTGFSDSLGMVFRGLQT